MAAQKRPFNEGKRHFKKNKKQKKSSATLSDGSNEEVLVKDVRRLLEEARISQNDNKQNSEATADAEVKGFAEGEVELEISELSSTGDGLAYRDGAVYVVPFTAPGDTVVGKVYRTVPGTAQNTDEGDNVSASYALADFVRVVKPSALRTEEPKCPYFTRCGGCQFQHLSYATQLEHKKRIVEKAYANFSRLPATAVPAVGDTIGSPLQYGYRTKLTPHFDGPPGGRRDRRHGKKPEWPEVPPIGFMLRGTRKTLDIEDCPIGTDVLRIGLTKERERVSKEINKYERGATLLLRESTERMDKAQNGEKSNTEETPGKNAERHGSAGGEDYVDEDRGNFIHRKRYITDQKAVSTEYVDDFRFDNPAGSFFQNNNSILPLVTQYIRDNILGSSASSNSEASVAEAPAQPKMKNLIDAYCGSGFFTVTLSPLFSNAIGIDISPSSIASASTNARLNNLPDDSTKFIAADANDLFASLKPSSSSASAPGSPKSNKASSAGQTFAPEETVVVIDPPRKGCDENFIRQLLAFAPARICYVSCNVHTQARDVGMLVGGDDEGEGMYEIESLRGFDFFPQTGHVEGVAMLRKRGV